MKTFLKIALLVIAVLVALKLLPLFIGLGCLLVTGLAGFLVVGVSFAVTVLGVALLIVVVLAPIWVPVLALVGLIALLKRSGRGPHGMAT